MFEHYLITALRGLKRQSLNSLINVGGLAVGFACVTFILLFVRSELSFDKWIPRTKQVYRVELSLLFPGQPPLLATTSPYLLGPTMKMELPEIASDSYIEPQSFTVRRGDRQFSEKWVDVVGSNFFKLIQLPFVQGSADTALVNPESIVISQSVARRYFSAASPMGRTLLLNGHALTVTGVIRDVPYNTQLKGGLFIPDTSTAEQRNAAARADWFAFAGWTYVRLYPGASASAVERKTLDLIGRHLDPGVLSALHARAQDVVRVTLTPFRSVHLTSDQLGGMRPGGSWTTIFGFAAIATLVLVIACFNFTNLATARATLRGTEVGLRKVVGAKAHHLITQFLGESVLVALLAFLISLALVEILLPAFDAFLGRPIGLHFTRGWPVLLGIATMSVFTGLMAGSYPAFVLSRFRPSAVLRSNASRQHGSGMLRGALVVAQFAISIGLGVAALVIFRQIQYARHLNYGFNLDDLAVLHAGSPAPNPAALRSFIATLRASPKIASVAASGAVPFQGPEDQEAATLAGNPQIFTVRPIDITPEFPVTYGMHLVAGRLLSTERGSDVNGVNELEAGFGSGKNILVDLRATRQMGLSARDAIGKTITVNGKHLTIVGVLNNVLFHGYMTVPVPTVYYYNPIGLSVISVRIKPTQVSKSLMLIDSVWRRFFPTVAIRRQFIKQSLDGLLVTDEREGEIFAIFVVVAIFIACLGLFGLASFIAERRTKEIGIRKVLGAATYDIVSLLLWQFSVPVIIAAFIASPIAWYYLHGWLTSYAYRIRLGPTYFAEAGAAAVVIACMTVTVHAVRVARAKPSNALRYE